MRDLFALMDLKNEKPDTIPAKQIAASARNSIAPLRLPVNSHPMPISSRVGLAINKNSTNIANFRKLRMDMSRRKMGVGKKENHWRCALMGAMISR